jgi:hypothetical protein
VHRNIAFVQVLSSMPLAPTNSQFPGFVYKRAKLKEEGRGGVGDGGLEIGRWKEGREP